MGGSLLEREFHRWQFVGERGSMVVVCCRERFIGGSLLEREVHHSSS